MEQSPVLPPKIKAAAASKYPDSGKDSRPLTQLQPGKEHSADDSYPYPWPKRRQDGVLLSAAACTLLFIAGLLVGGFYVVKSVTQQRDASVPKQYPESNIKTASSAWVAFKILILAFFWALPVYFGLSRLLGQGMLATQAMGSQLPHVVQALAGKFPAKECSEILSHGVLGLASVAMWWFFSSYAWNTQGHDMCSARGLKRRYSLSTEERESPWAILFTEGSWQVQVVALVWRHSGFQRSLKGYGLMVICAVGLNSLMLWTGPCWFAALMQKLVVLLLGIYMAVWFIANAEVLFGGLRETEDFDFRQAHAECMLFLLVLWTASSAPVAVFCETDSCGRQD